ncbi:cytochrome P450 monooxygenase [Rhizoctonia solani AG-1 IA]|uniref:Cytochrome P450 monooxygenase n=1 Tax=Thanatephorus cucumeris (strain AG1-IA) TaxID=983506 RepID=L8X5R1_THACA|nr:cytochrome P450 monooxygenase [Rhizoctonia solani AG-1 IA]
MIPPQWPDAPLHYCYYSGATSLGPASNANGLTSNCPQFLPCLDPILFIDLVLCDSINWLITHPHGPLTNWVIVSPQLRVFPRPALSITHVETTTMRHPSRIYSPRHRLKACASITGRKRPLAFLMSLTLTDWSPTLVYVPIGVAAHLVPYLLDPHNYRRPTIKGPWLNALSDAWLAHAAAQGDRSELKTERVRIGKFVRLAPNHISIADPEALQIVYAHGNGTLKTEFYDAFVSIRRGLFNTRDRAEHTRKLPLPRKRKLVSHVFSQQNVLAFEPHIRRHVRKFCAQWDERCMLAAKGENGADWEARDGRAWFDCLPHYNYLAFDIIGDLAFGSPFGMIPAQRDSAPMIEHVESNGDGAKSTKRTVKHVPAIKILNDRGDYAASLGVMPPWWRPWAKRVPWYARGNQAVQCLAGLAVAAVTKRLEEGLPDEEDDEDEEGEQGEVKGKKKRTDLLEKLLQGKDESGAPMGREELTAEALTQLIAGSDTTSKDRCSSSCAITYYLAANPEKQRKLQAELDEHLSPRTMTTPATSFENVKSLPYLNACINEGLRLHATSSMGLPRVIPPGTVLEVCGEKFGPGSVLSVPSFTIHRDQAVWGEDVEAFRPERWIEAGTDVQAGVGTGPMAKAFNPFSYGPRAHLSIIEWVDELDGTHGIKRRERTALATAFVYASFYSIADAYCLTFRACVGRNLASMELQIIISSVFARYEFELLKPNELLKTREGFLRKPLDCYVGMKRRAEKN